MDKIEKRFRKLSDISNFVVNSYEDGNRMYVSVTIVGSNNSMSVRTILKIGELFYKYGRAFHMNAIIGISKSATILIETNVDEDNIIQNPMEKNVIVLNRILEELESSF